MNLKKKTTQKTSGTHKYKPGQLVTINHRVFRIVKKNTGAWMIACVVMTEIMKNMISA